MIPSVYYSDVARSNRRSFSFFSVFMRDLPVPQRVMLIDVLYL